MCQSAGRGLRYLIIFLTMTSLHLADAAITVRPKNTAVRVGSNATFNCTVNTTRNKIWWTWTGSGTNIVRNCIVPSSYHSRFAVESTEPGACNLIVFSASLADAGKYTCVDRSTDGIGPSSTARLVVLSRVLVTVNVTSKSFINDGDRLQYMCTATLNGTIYPSLAWTSQYAGASPTKGILNLRNNTKLSYSFLRLTARRPEVPQFTCAVYFHESAARHFLSPNDKTVPTYTDQFTFDAIKTLLCPTNISVNSSLSAEVPVGSVFTCRADGHPEPNYTWIDSMDNVVAFGPNIQLMRSGPYLVTCKASSSIAACNNITATINGTVLNGDAPDKHSATENKESSDLLKGIIVLGVFFGISLIVNILLTALLCRRDRKLLTKTESSPRTPANLHEVDPVDAPQQTVDATSAYTSLDVVTRDTVRPVYEELAKKQ